MATAAETLKTSTEKYTAAGSQAFKDAVEKSLTALNDMNTHSKSNLEAVVASVTAATKGAETLGAQVTAYSKKTAEDHMAATKTLTSAKSLQEAVEFQTTYAKSFFDAYLTEVNKWSDIVSGSMKESLRPINERVSAVVEQFQTAR